jgi:PleD family two-component response regulator
MAKVYILGAPNNYIDNLIKDLKNVSVDTELAISLFELKKKVESGEPSAVLVADNLKEKKVEELLHNLLEDECTSELPLVGVTTTEDYIESTLTFFNNGAVDVLHLPAEIEETYARIKLRIRESSFQNTLTSSKYFFSEAQEKEQGKRNGYFNFYDHRRIKVGEIAVKEGMVVSATYGDTIKEDAFLQLACNPNLTFRFSDKTDVKAEKIKASITSLLLEASKFNDEIKKQDSRTGEKLKCLIIDNSRIARLLASRTLKQLQVDSKVVGSDEFTIRLMTQYTPNFLLIDYGQGEKVLDMIWQAGHSQDDIPVIIYCDEDIKNLNFNRIGKHIIEAVMHKDEVQKNMPELLSKMFNFTAEK